MENFNQNNAETMMMEDDVLYFVVSMKNNNSTAALQIINFDSHNETYHEFISNNQSLNLTYCELNVLNKIIDGYSNDEIAALLKMSKYSVKKNIASLYEKFKVTDKIGLVVKAVKRRIDKNKNSKK
jgi:DNA-binding NarL/FixJ family response regulator